MNETGREYLKRINFVIDFIEKNLDADLSLQYLAEKAQYSPYHFHRVFVTVVNERLNEFVNRKRLERIAAMILVTPHLILKEVVYTYGFTSMSSFSRAFKKYYGVSPTKFRSEGKEILSKIGIAPFSSENYICSIDTDKQWMTMNAQITIKELSERKLACISHIGEFDTIGSAFQQLIEWGHQQGVLDTSNFKALTVYHDNPHVTQTSKLRCSAGVTISNNIKADGEIRQLTLHKGVFVVGHFEIKTEEIAKAWKNLCIWIIKRGLEFRDGDYFEVYHNDHRTHPEQKIVIDICIPIEKTKTIKLGEPTTVDFLNDKEMHHPCKKDRDTYQLIQYMKEIRAFFSKEYEALFTLGNIYQGNPEYSYFSLKTAALKPQKLKFVIILNHNTLSFSICLSGQNKSIRKKVWELFNDSDWNTYHLAASIDDSLSIVDHTIVEEADFNNKKSLIQQIERESLAFVSEITAVLAY